MHGRQKKGVQSPEPAVDTIFQNMTDEELQVELLTTKSDTSRHNWLLYALKDLSSMNGSVEATSLFDDILMAILEDKKNPANFVKGCEVATLATLWGITESEKQIENAMYELLSLNNHTGTYGLQVLNSLLVILLTAESIPYKLVEGAIKSVLAPKIHKAADQLIDSLSGSTEETEELIEDHPALLEHLTSWQACIANLPSETIKTYINDVNSSFITLLEHPVDAVRIQVAHCILSILDLAERHDIDISHEKEEITKVMTKVIYDHDFDWGNGDSRKVFEQLAEMIKNDETVVAIDVITISAQPNRNQRINSGEYSFYDANADKKGHPIAGYADAAVIQFFYEYLGANFNEFFSANKARGSRSTSRTSSALISIAARHPAARSSSIHLESIRTYGSSSWNAANYRPEGRRHRKVKVEDYM